MFHYNRTPPFSRCEPTVSTHGHGGIDFDGTIDEHAMRGNGEICPLLLFSIPTFGNSSSKQRAPSDIHTTFISSSSYVGLFLENKNKTNLFPCLAHAGVFTGPHRMRPAKSKPLSLVQLTPVSLLGPTENSWPTQNHTIPIFNYDTKTPLNNDEETLHRIIVDAENVPPLFLRYTIK